MRNYLSILIVLLMFGCINRPQLSVITANAKLIEQMDSVVGDIYERDTIKGDFNGDGKIECAYIEYAKDFDHNGTLIFNDSTMPKMVSQYYMIWDMINVGDVNNDQKDEICLYLHDPKNDYIACTIYTLYNGRWADIFPDGEQGYALYLGVDSMHSGHILLKNRDYERISLPLKTVITDDDYWIDWEYGKSRVIKFKDSNFFNGVIDEMYQWGCTGGNWNDLVSEDEALNLTRLYLSDKNIHNMDEIKFFENLYSLDCSNNQITSLDLSKNKKLEYLSLDNNPLQSLYLPRNHIIININIQSIRYQYPDLKIKYVD